MTVALLLLVGLLAYANGANDNSKGVATLVGYGTASPRTALAYAMMTTAVGAAISFWFSNGLLKAFSTGLFEKGASLDARFFIAVLIGAFGWVTFATFTGLPVSTTHAITGALVGAGWSAHAPMHWAFLGKSFVTPLGLGPVLSLAAAYAVAWGAVGIVQYQAGKRLPAEETLIHGATRTAFSGADSTSTTLMEDPAVAEAEARYSSAVGLHWLSSGLIGFARGWNDTPKIAALALVALPGKMFIAFIIVAVAMAAGGLVSGRKVLETLARKLTPLPLPEALSASLTTAAFVCLASWKGLPVSTTHVSTGAIIGAGLKNDARAVKWKKVTEIALSWVITLPFAALLAAAAKWFL